MDLTALQKSGLVWGFNALMLAVLLPLFIPFTPIMPGLTIDASWALALNQAVSQGLAFGRDIVFTLGPYSAIYTKAYHPDTAYLMYGGCLCLALSYGLLLIGLMKDTAWRWRWALIVLFLVMIYSRDALLLSYPLLLGLSLFKCHLPHPSRTLLVLTTAPLGLLVLVKGTLLLLTLLILFTASLYLFLKNKTIPSNPLACLSSGLMPVLAPGQSVTDRLTALSREFHRYGPELQRGHGVQWKWLGSPGLFSQLHAVIDPHGQTL